jgi:endoglucanase
VLHGVDRSGTEYQCVHGYGIFDGPNDAASVQAIAAWHTNAVRAPLNEDCWLGINGINPAYAGANYQQAIGAYVNLLNQNGMVAILDLHWNAPGSNLATGQEPMPDADHSVTFWTSVANYFKSNSSVIFDLYNEPYPDNNQDTTAAWTCWKNGGTCSGVPFQTAGMQTLVTSVRNTGSQNVIMLGGVEYGECFVLVAHLQANRSHR